MTHLRRFKGLFLGLLVTAFVALPTLALAGPRSGGSFGGRSGFRSAPSFSRSRSYSTGRNGGTNVIVTPGFGWGLGGWGWGPFGYGGGFGLGTLVMVAVVGLGAVAVMRAVRNARRAGHPDVWGDDEGGDVVAMPAGRAYVYKLQLGLGRSARGIQDRLTKFAEEGDTSSEAGLAHLLQQTSVELLREKHSIRYGAVEAAGPMSLTNAETKMNGITLAERSRFQVERVRGADGAVRRSSATAEEGKDALEYVMVTVVVGSRTSLGSTKQLNSAEDVEAILSELGGVAPSALLGLEVVWTPADGNDSLTETDLITTYPHLRGL